MSVARVWKHAAWAVVICLAAQIMPGLPELPSGARPAFADPPDPSPPPAPVNPAPAMRVVETSGPTEAPAEITKDTVWGPLGSPYIVRGGPLTEMTIRADVSLTLLPGTVVKIDQGVGIRVVGQLLALGTPNRHVVITSLRDDSVLGDTNGDGSATAPAKGDWLWVRVNPGSDSNRFPVSIVDHTDLRYGGYGGWGCNGDRSPIKIEGPAARVLVTNSRIEESTEAAISVPAYVSHDARSYVGVFNSTIASSGCGVYGVRAGRVDIVGNTFTATVGTAVRYLNPVSLRLWFNTVHTQSVIQNGSGPSPTRQQADVRFNALLGGFRAWASYSDLLDWSGNWFGRDANEVLPACLDPAAAAAYYPPITTTSSSECPAGQVKVVGYTATVTPALSASPLVLPETAREAAAPRFGPVNTYTGALTHQVDDLALEDAGKTVTATRTFRSDRLNGGDVGPGWTSAFSESLSTSDGVATLSFSDGSSAGFLTDPAAGYVPAPGVTADFSATAAGSTVTTPGQTSYQFNPAGELTGLILGDPGHQLTVQRSGGRVSRVTGVSGRYLGYARSGGALASVADQTGRSVNFGYAEGRLASARGVDSQTERYAYDAAGRLVQVTTPEGRVKLAAAYHADGRVAWVDLQGKGRATFGYDDANRRRTVTLADNTVITQEYDWAGRLVTERTGRTGTHVVYDGEGRIVSTVTGVPDAPMEGYAPSAPATFHDAKGDPVLEVDPTGRFTATTFDARHKPLVTTRTDGSTVSRTYDTQGRLTTLTDPLGKVWQYTYSSRGQVTSQRDPLNRTRTVGYVGNGDATSVTDETGATTTFGYDVHGRRISITDPLQNVTTVAYTAWNQVRQITRPRGGATTTTFDNDRQVASVTEPTDGVTRYTYDTAGRLLSTVDPLDGGTSLGYDSLGRVVSVTDPRGSVLRRSHSAEGWVATSTDPANAVTSYAYDPAGRLYRVTDALTQVTQYLHDRAGRPTDIWTPDGGHTVHGYDPLGRRSTITTPRGHIWKTDYDSAGRPTRTIDPLTFTTSVTYDAIGRAVSRTDQNGAVTTYTYDDVTRSASLSDQLGQLARAAKDAAGRVVSETDGAGVETTYQYDADGNVTAITDAAGAWRLEYDLAGRPTAQVDALNRRTTASYDVSGRLTGRVHPDTTTEAFVYDPVGNLTRRTDRTGRRWDYSYDTANRVTAATDPLLKATRYTYDALGRQASVTDPSGVVANVAYDPVGRPAVRWDATGASWVTTYDPDGNLARTVDPANAEWTYTYNNRGELTRKRWGASGSTVYDYTYDKVGRVLTAKEPYLTTFEYDVRGRRTAAVDGVGGRTTFAYDPADRLVTRIPPSTHASTWTYDASGRMRTAVDALGNTSRYDWDAAGQLTKITLPRGGIHAYAYTAAGRVATETDPLGAVTSFAYDSEGRLTSTTYPSGRTVTAGYDAAGRRTELTAGGQTRTFGYDAAGRLTSATAPGAAPLSFAYDNRGLVVRSTDGFGDTTYTHDVAGRLASVTPPVGPATTYTYDASRGLLATVRGGTNADFTGYDGAGQLLTRTAVAPSASGYETRSYDTAGRLSSVNSPGYFARLTYHPDGQIATLAGPEATPKVTTHGYDHAGRLTSTVVTQGGNTLSSLVSTWDADGNRTSVARNGQPPVTGVFDLADRLTSTTDGVTYGYDADGLQTSAGATSYGYNHFGEMVSASSGGSAVTYGRDALGRISSRTAVGVTQSLGYDGGSAALAVSRTGSGPATTMVRTPGGSLLAEATAGAITQQAWVNVHGDLVALKDDTGPTVRWQAEYDPFGRVTSTTGSAPVALGFQSRLTDPLTGLVDMGFRQYDPASGRFTARDSIVGALSAPISLNRYLYANGDPVDFFDPDGHWPEFLDQALSFVSNTWNVVTSAVSQAWDALTSAVSQTVDKVTTAISQAWDTAKEKASSTWTAVKRKAAEQGRKAKILAAEVTTRAQKFWQDHGDQIIATVASAVVGIAVFGVCTALTAGGGALACMGLAGAAAGALYGGMMCPEGTSTWKCVGVGAVAGGLAGLTFGAVSAAGANLFLAGGASGLVGDAADQLLTTGEVDPVRLVIATAGGGAFGWLGGKVPGLRGRPSKPQTTNVRNGDAREMPVAPRAQRGEATVYLDAEAGHASIKVTYGGVSLHTEQLGSVPGRPAVAREFSGTLSPKTDPFTIPLPDGAAAIKAQREGLLQRRIGTYDHDIQSCVTYCMDILAAGGRVDAPTTTQDAITWLRETIFR